MFRFAGRATAVFGVAILLGSCGASDGPTGPHQAVVAKVAISGAPADGVLLVGSTLALLARSTDASGQTLNQDITWTSTNAAVATVSQQGVVMGLAAGNATITASNGSVGDTALLHVRVSVAATTSGQTTVTTVLDGRVTLTIPANAVPGGVTQLTVGPAASPPPSAELLPNAAFDFGPSGTQFATPLTLTLKFDPETVPEGDRAGLAIYHVAGGGYEEITGSVADTATNAVSAQISSFSTYALLRRARPASMAVAGGGDQAVPAGADVPVRPSVRVRDVYGRPLRLARVTFAVVSGGGSITGAVQTTDENGLATIGSWTLGSVAGANSLSATVAGIAQVTIGATGIAGPAAQLAVTTQPLSVAAGAPLRVVMTALDAHGNIAVGFTGAVSLALASNPGNATLGGTTTVNAVAGVATFAAFSINRAAAGYTLVATAVQLTPATTSAFNIVGGAAALLEFLAYPAASAVVGSALGTVTVVARDDFANVATFSGAVGLVVVAGSGAVAGTYSANAVNGMAAFDVFAPVTAGVFRLRATAAGFTTQGEAIEGVPAAPARLLIAGGNNQTGVGGSTLSQPLAVQVSDNYGNAIAAAGRTVSFSASAGSVTPASAITDVEGRASAMWMLGESGGVQAATATSTGLTAAAFTATSTSPPPGVRITISTTGSDIPESFRVDILRCFAGSEYCSCIPVGCIRTVQPQAQFTVDLPAGTYRLFLSNLELNCTFTDAPYKDATVSSGRTNVTLGAVCLPAGTIHVTTPTTGIDLPDGYQVYVDDQFAGGKAVDVATDIKVAQGLRTVSLGELPPNCAVTGTNPLPV
ncbi:MAG TPA: Ig-like domain-containing protein, partial [Gemmatimonadaceae bacterium]|nr:Ig-like domain-containing protein [Gemmatimonadaceae bacterium]